MKIFSRVVFIVVLLLHPGGTLFAQEDAPETLDLSCDEVTPACNDTPEHIKLYLDVMSKILGIIDSQPSQATTETPSSITEATLGEKSNTSAFLNEVGNTLFNYDGVFDDYRFLDTASATLKRDRDKIQQMYFNVLDVNTLIEKQLTKKDVPEDVYKQIDVQLKRLGYIQFGSADGTYNLERKGEEYSTLIKLLSRINQMYAELYQDKFYTELFNGLGTEAFKSFVTPSDTTEKDVDDEKLDLLKKRSTVFTYNMFVNPFEDVRKSNTKSSEYVEIDYSEFIKMIWDLENAYRCTHGRQNVCTDGTLQLRENFKSLYKDTLQNDAEKSGQVITDATHRLKGVFFGADADGTNAGQERKQALLESRYGAGGKPSDRGFFQSIGEFGAQFLEGSRRRTVDPVKEYIEDRITRKSSNQEVSSTSQGAGNVTHVPVNRYSTDASKTLVLERLEENRADTLRDGDLTLSTTNGLQQNQQRVLANKLNRITSSFEKYSQEKQKKRTNDLLVLDTKAMTKQTVLLSVYIHAAANQLGDYDKDSESTVSSVNDSLSKMCEAQCTNLNDKKCREDL